MPRVLPVAAAAEDHDSLARPSDRSFGLVFSAAFLIVGLLPLRAGTAALRAWPFALSLFVAFISAVKPTWLAPANRLWFRFGRLLHRVVSPLVMAALFYVALTPVALMCRVVRPGSRRAFAPDPAAPSYWTARDQPPSPMTEQF